MLISECEGDGILRMKQFLLVFGFLALLPGLCGAQQAKPLRTAVLILFENTPMDRALKNPGFRALASEGAVLTNYSAITNPSQPNYIALMGGDTLGVYADNNVSLSQRNFADLLERKGLSWKVYAEGYPGRCALGASYGAYVRKHNPLISFTSIQSQPQRCANILPATSFASDLVAGNLPNFSHYVPDLNNSGHDSGVSGAGAWVNKFLLPWVRSSRGQEVTWFITFDEGNFLNNQVLTLVIGDQVKVGAESAQEFNHYSLLRTLEDGFGVGNLGRQDATANPFSGIWK